MTVLYRRGARGPDVANCQNALNLKLRPPPNLVADGIFGALTDAAVRAFQRQAGLVVDGIIGPNTYAALMIVDAYPPIMHKVPFIPQPTDTTCWAAATAMMKNSTVAAIRAKTPASMLLSDGSLYNHSDINDHVTGGQAYGRVHGLRYHPPMSHTVAGFRGIVQSSPVMLNMLWRPGTYAKGQGSPGHMVVVVGMRGDGDQSGRDTILHIYDPWAPNRGNRETVTYFKKSNDTPLFTYGMYTR
ncbi:MAG: peptidoglycan-binding protein [Pseudomonadota bacterium]